MNKNYPRCDVHMYPKKKNKCRIYVFVKTIFGGHSALSPIKCSYYTSLRHMKEKWKGSTYNN